MNAATATVTAELRVAFWRRAHDEATALVPSHLMREFTHRPTQRRAATSTARSAETVWWQGASRRTTRRR